MRSSSSPERSERIQTELLPGLVANVELGDDMLEIGPGPGAATERLAPQMTRHVALELDAGTVRALGSKHKQDNAEVVVGDAAALGFADASFDSVGCFTVLHHLPTAVVQAATLSEMSRVLRPGGVLITSATWRETSFTTFTEMTGTTRSSRRHFSCSSEPSGSTRSASTSMRGSPSSPTRRFTANALSKTHASRWLRPTQRKEGDLVMNQTKQLRLAVIGLLAFAGVEEESLLSTAADSESGTPARWAARHTVAHNSEFKQQQVRRLEAVRRGEVPLSFAEIDHAADEVYRRYDSQRPNEVAQACRQVCQALIEETATASDEDLLDTSRHLWLSGRPLWLQVVVRGFWHPTSHISDYYLARGETTRALDLQARGVRLGEVLAAPALARGMAGYNMACAQARSRMDDEALSTLAGAIALNPQLRANSRRDKDLASLGSGGSLKALLGPR